VEPGTIREPVPEAVTAKPKNFFSRWGGVYVSPAKTFKEIGASPQVAVPIIALIVLGLLTGLCLIMTLDLQSMAVLQLEKAVQQGSMTKQQMEQALPIVSKVMGAEVMIMFLIGGLINALIVAGFAKLFSTILGAENRFKALFSVTLYTVIAISILHYVLLVLIVYVKRPTDVDISSLNYVVTSSLGGVLSSIFGEDALPKFLMKLALYVDVFAIWIITLLAIGYSAVSRKLKTATAATWLGVAYGIIALLGAALLARFT